MKIINEAYDLLIKENFTIERLRVGTDNEIKRECINDIVITEHHLNGFINDQLAFKLICTPEKLDALVLGFLLSEGYLDSTDDIDYIYICKSGERAKVQLKKIISLAEINHDTTSESISCCFIADLLAINSTNN